MQKIVILTLALIIMSSLCACRKQNIEQATAATEPQAPTEQITIPSMPDMTMPSTNIPDPTVDSHSEYTETEATEN